MEEMRTRTTEDSSVVRQEGQQQVTRRVQQYNFDASVGYALYGLTEEDIALVEDTS